MMTDLNLGNPVRERYARRTDITVTPVPEFATILGVNLAVVTSDGFVVIAERSTRAHVAGGKLHTSIAENLLRPVDSGPDGAPDPFRCAMRAAQEELGLDLAIDELTFNAFGVEPALCQYSLLGCVHVSESKDEVQERWSLGTAKDKWESKNLIFVAHKPREVAEYVQATMSRWSSIGLATIVLSLYSSGYSHEAVRAKFDNVFTAG
ncbi:hypothetical protein AB0K48_10175 [Nonomuraea sp. NPDC055795]